MLRTLTPPLYLGAKVFRIKVLAKVFHPGILAAKYPDSKNLAHGDGFEGQACCAALLWFVPTL